LAVLIGVSNAVMMVLARNLPSAEVRSMAAASIVMILAGARLAHWERKENRPLTQSVTATLLCVVAPHILAGLGFAVWMIHEGLDIRLGLGALVAISAVSATLLMRRIPQMFASLAATWAPLALVDGSLMSVGALVLVGIVMFVVAQLQINIEKEDMTRAQSRERARNRYEDILRDYEDIGQG
jgi:hypothetical protein